jgi:hypothetical protein
MTHCSSYSVADIIKTFEHNKTEISPLQERKTLRKSPPKVPPKPAAQSSTLFGGTQPQTTGTFGAPTQQAGAFGSQPTATNSFGGATTRLLESHYLKFLQSRILLE